VNPVRSELKPLLEYLARLTFEELVREASAQPAATDHQVGASELEEKPPLFLRGQVAAITPIGLRWHEHADGFLVDVTAARALSGGPVCNSEGQVIGVFTGGVEKEESVIDPATKKPIDGHVVPIPYSIGRVMPIDWGFIQSTVNTLLEKGLAVHDGEGVT
jgi:hypothetical protein